jgi:hypothetical protein
MMNTKQNDEGNDFDVWAHSIKACALSTSYAHYLELMTTDGAKLDAMLKER